MVTAKITALYIFFAGISTLVNILSQIISFLMYSGPLAVEISILTGTLFGLPLRYFLEKRYIFSYRSSGLKHDSKLFLLYSFLGIFTTLVFWSIEYLFHIIFASEIMRYFGGVIGLAIGYYMKYHLDKRFVFVYEISRVTIK